MLASFAFTGSTVSRAPLKVEKLSFDIDKSFAVTSSNWSIGIHTSPDRHDCSIESSTRVNCIGIPDVMGTFSEEGVTINLYGSVGISELGEKKTIQVRLIDPGTLGEDGAV